MSIRELIILSSECFLTKSKECSFSLVLCLSLTEVSLSNFNIQNTPNSTYIMHTLYINLAFFVYTKKRNNIGTNNFTLHIYLVSP